MTKQRIETGIMCKDLADYRVRMGLSQADMAAALGVPQPTYTRWENGVRIPRPAFMVRITAVTGGAVRPDHFYAAPDPDHAGQARQ